MICVSRSVYLLRLARYCEYIIVVDPQRYTQSNCFYSPSRTCFFTWSTLETFPTDTKQGCYSSILQSRYSRYYYLPIACSASKMRCKSVLSFMSSKVGAVVLRSVIAGPFRSRAHRVIDWNSLPPPGDVSRLSLMLIRIRSRSILSMCKLNVIYTLFAQNNTDSYSMATFG